MARQRRAMDLIMKKILEFHGNGSIVDTASYKRQAGEAPSTKLQAPSKESAKQQAHAKRATNCRMTICPIDKAPKAPATLCRIDTIYSGATKCAKIGL